MAGDHRFGIVSANVHHAEFDDEIVVINTLVGCYYSLRGAAVDVWLLAEGSASRNMMVDALAARYDGAREEIAAAIDRCLAELTRHGLICVASAADGSVSPVTRNGPRRALPEPLIECFDDLRDLLVLDPIHEVSEAGWPQPLADRAE